MERKMALIKKLAKSIKNVIIQELLNDNVEEKKVENSFTTSSIDYKNNPYSPALIKYTNDTVSGSEQKMKELETLVTRVNSKVTSLADKMNSLEEKINNLTVLHEELLFSIDQAKVDQDKDVHDDLNLLGKKFGIN